MAAPVVASSTSAQKVESGSATVTITKPIGVTAGDMLLCIYSTFVRGVVTLTPVVPTGWTVVPGTAKSDNNGSTTSFCYFAYRVADGTEGASFVFDQSGASSNQGAAIMLRITGASGIDVVASAVSKTSTSFSLPSVTTTGADLVIYGGNSTTGSSSTWSNTVPSGSTKVKNINDTTHGMQLGLCSVTQSAVGSSGAFTASTGILDSAYPAQGITVSIKPATSGGGGSTPASTPSAVCYLF